MTPGQAPGEGPRIVRGRMARSLARSEFAHAAMTRMTIADHETDGTLVSDKVGPARSAHRLDAVRRVACLRCAASNTACTFDLHWRVGGSTARAIKVVAGREQRAAARTGDGCAGSVIGAPSRAGCGPRTSCWLRSWPAILQRSSRKCHPC